VAYNLGKMEQICKIEALELASNWVRQGQVISMFGFDSSIALSAKKVRVAMCLDECTELSLGMKAHSIFLPLRRSSEGSHDKASRRNLSICFQNSN
jgi:hypothetical protein